MNREEFMKTLYGYVPNKLADMLAELAEDEGYFDEEDVLPLSEATDSDLLAELSRREPYRNALGLDFNSLVSDYDFFKNSAEPLRKLKSDDYETWLFVTRNMRSRGHRRTKE